MVGNFGLFKNNICLQKHYFFVTKMDFVLDKFYTTRISWVYPVSLHQNISNIMYEYRDVCDLVCAIGKEWQSK